MNIQNNSITLQWEKIDGKSAQLTQQILQVSNLLIQTYTQQELEFAHKHPEQVKNEHFLKPLASLFESKQIDWKSVESHIKEIFQQFFTRTDFAQFSQAGEYHYFVTAIDKRSGKTLGFIQFIQSPEYPTGTIKAGMFGIAFEAQDLGLEQILMSSIFKIVPDTQKIRVHVRSTNTKALNLYQSWGFIPMEHQESYWVNLEYNAENKSVLQYRAQSLA